MSVVENQCVKSFINVFSSVVHEEFGFKSSWTVEEKIKYLNIAFAFAFAWAFGGCLTEKENEKVDNFIKKKFPSVEFQADNIINCYIDCADISLKLYSSTIEKYEIGTTTSFWELLIPTVDTIKISNLIAKHFDLNKHVFLTGASGTGKSVLASNILKNFQTEKNIDTLKMNFSA